MRSPQGDQRRSSLEPPPRPWRPWPAALAALLMVLAGPAAADEPAGQHEAILTAAKTAVAQKKFVRTKVLGFHEKQHTFTELPRDGAILVGLDLGLGKFFNIELIYALRAVYRTPKGLVVSGEHGLFGDKPMGNGRFLKSQVTRTVRLRIPSNCAVTGMTLRSGLLVNGLSLSYMRIDGKGLDKRRVYQTAWVGDRTGGSERQVDTGGAPVVGLFGSQAEDHVKSLSFIYIRP